MAIIEHKGLCERGPIKVHSDFVSRTNRPVTYYTLLAHFAPFVNLALLETHNSTYPIRDKE
jgi:hypothetical protein